MTVAETLTSALTWYLALTALGLATYPIVVTVARYLPDRGISLARPAGLAIVPLPLWIVGNAIGVPFTWWSVSALLLALAIPGWLYSIKQQDLVQTLRDRWRALLAFEGATFLLFLGYVVFRSYNPDISGTEKPMELAFLNASIHSGEIPIEDPWFAGESINYYYYGYVAIAAISILTNIPGEIAFNLALATVFSLAIVAAAGLAANISSARSPERPWHQFAAALLAGFLMGFAANLHATWQLITSPRATLEASWWDGPGWGSSRIIEDTGFADGSVRMVITEFPAFSWILGDLHPHVIAYPWLIVALALVFNLYLKVLKSSEDSLASFALSSGAVGVACGVLYAANTWDVPVIAVLTGLVLIPLASAGNWRVLTASVTSAVAGCLISAGTFVVRYDAPTTAEAAHSGNVFSLIPGIRAIVSLLGYVSWNRSSMSELLTHWGGMMLMLAVLLAIWLCTYQKRLRDRWVPVAAGLPLLAVASIMLQAPALFLFGVPTLLLMLMIDWTGQSPEKLELPLLAIVTALLMLIALEFFFLRDPFGDRMNTVFKFSFQAWALLAIGISSVIPDAIASVRRRLAALATIVLVLGILSSSIYAPLSAYRWTSEFDRWNGMDGIAYIEHFHPDEQSAIEWVRDNRDSIQTVLEAPGCAYGAEQALPHSRISMATGTPTVIGWDGHQRQWRRGQQNRLAELGPRIDAARVVYEQPEQARELIERYEITHVVVGLHELSGYQRCDLGPPYAIPSLEMLDSSGWELAFEEGDVRIYSVTGVESAN